jgi:histidinol-phosphatase (PHP family)
MHTPLCLHAEGEPTELAAHAERVGLREIGFSDHNPMPQEGFDNWRMRLSDLDDYVERVRRARVEHPALVIKLAMEVDYLPGAEDWVRELARRHPWDYFIGSVHYIDGGWDIDSPFRKEEWTKRDADEVWSAYFERLTMAAQSGLFEIIGHADLCKKFAFYPRADFTPIYKKFLAAAAGAGVAIELNTAGLRKECQEIYPSPAILRLAREAGVPITFGSDAHAPGEVGMNFAEAVRLAKAHGYTHYCNFTARRKEMAPLSG